MPTHAFSVGEMLKTGWIKFKQQPLTWIFALLIELLIGASHPLVVNWLKAGTESGFHTTLLILISILYFLVDLGLTLGLIYMGIRVADNQPIHVGHLFARFHYVFHYLIAKFVFGLMILVGMLLLVFPAAIWGMRYGLFPFFIIDKGVGPIRALEMSSVASKGAKWDLFAFFIVSMILVLAGLISLFFGVFVALPPLYIAWGYIYRRLTTPIAIQPVDVTLSIPTEMTVT